LLRRIGPAVLGAALLLTGCGENLFAPPAFDIVFLGPVRHPARIVSAGGGEIYLCENVEFLIRGVSSRPGASAEWLGGRLESYSLRTGNRTGTTPLGRSSAVEFWGFERLAEGETRSSEAFDFQGSDPFLIRAEFFYQVPRGFREVFRLEMRCE
jgi:hypothetical protein